MTLKKLYMLLIVSISLLNIKLYAAPVADNMMETTMGTVVSLPQKLPDGRVESTISGGLLKRGNSLEDGNLFHSFHDFNISQGEVVTFDPSLKVTNILARVTGDTISSIDGELKANANLYLLNPSGFIFSENAKLDIQGSFYASTADGVNLEGGGKFLARSPNESKLTMAQPSAFGFLSSQPASIEIRGDTLAIKNQTYYAPNGQINVTATDIRLEDSTLYAPNGKINITANRDLQISQSSVIEMKDGKPVMDENGDPWPRSIGMVDVSGERGGGQIFIRAGHFVLDRALIYADNYGDGQGFSIDIDIDGGMFLKNAAKITTDNYANGYGGNLKITARTLLQLSGQNGEWHLKREQKQCQDCFSTIAANNTGPGDNTKPFQSGGNIQINTSTLEITPGLIQSATQTNGPAGNTTIVADKVILKGQKYEAPDKYEKQGYIAANTRGQGQGGTINITAKDMISLDDSNITAKTDSIGKAGDISIKTEKLNLANKGIISSLSNLDGSNAGSAGSIDIEAGTINISTDRNVPISKDTWNDVSGIAVMAKKARGGNIDIEVRDSLSLVHSKITARSTGPNSSDNGGNIWINRPPFSKLKGFTLDDGYLLASANAGDGGNIGIWLEKLTLLGKSVIDYSSQGGLYGEFWLNSVKLSGVLALSKEKDYLKTDSLPKNRCTSFSKENQSRFTITARDTLPRCPEDLRTQTIRLGNYY